MRSLTYVRSQLHLLEIILSLKKGRFCKVHMSNETSIKYQ